MPGDADRPSSVTLEIALLPRASGWALDVQDERGGRRVPLAGARLVVGSSSKADVVLRDPTVSAKHCGLSVLGSGVTIEDLGSLNGTFVGNARVKEAWGAAGTVVTLGRSSVTIHASIPAVEEVKLDEPLDDVAGASIPMRALAAQVRRLAQHGAPVLIAGETGTGKELVARALHAEGPRRERPFVAINVAALPRELVESELFGHERGAFTGAVARRAGAFEEADGGSIFLDEIGELPLDAQPKLLRALDGYEVRRVGGSGSGRRANVRVIAATHVPLEERVTHGQFRRDLFHRLEVFVVHVPPLRLRRGDVGPIARELLAKLAPELGRRELTSAALARLTSHDWPGNVRELRNVLYRAADAAGRPVIDAHDLEQALVPRRIDLPSELTPDLAKAILDAHNGNWSAAARAAGYARTTFRKIAKS
jgi:DNA-binding NtrC family response regulator